MARKTPADRGKSVNGGRGDGWKDVLRKDVPLRGNGGNFLGFAVQQSAVGAGKHHRICSTDE